MKVRILSIDGGGVRGIVPAVILQYIEEKIQDITKDPEARLSDFIDFAAGTSTGSIISSMILIPNEDARPKYKMEDIVAAYFELADKVFKKDFWRNIKTVWGIFGPKYSPNNINTQLLNKLDHWKMIDLLKPCAFTAYDIKKRRPTIYTNRDDKLKYADYYIKDIVRASTSIPAYFEPAYFRNGVDINTMIDGGTFANNPSIVAYLEAIKTKEIKEKFKIPITPSDVYFLSFGTGKSNLDSYTFRKVKRWGMLKWFIPILNILLQGASNVVNYEMEKIFEIDNSSNNFNRINAPIIQGSSSAEDGSKENMKRLRQDALNYINENKEYLNDIAKTLVKENSSYKKLFY